MRADPASAPAGEITSVSQPPVIPPPRVQISVCTVCRAAGAEADDPGRPGEDLLAALLAAGLPEGVEARPVQCLSVCKRPCTVAMTGPDRYTYVFGDLDPVRDAPALLDCAATFAGTEHGYMLWRERPTALRRGIVARIPPLGWQGEAGRHPR